MFPGDLIDRGPDSAGVIERLQGLRHFAQAAAIATAAMMLHSLVDYPCAPLRCRRCSPPAWA